MPPCLRSLEATHAYIMSLNNFVDSLEITREPQGHD